jgi:hypothetical protein
VSIYTAIAQSYSFGPTYLVAESESELREQVKATFSEFLRIDGESGPNAALYFGHDCRVIDDLTGHVLGTDGYPDEIATCDDHGNVRYAVC